MKRIDALRAILPLIGHHPVLANLGSNTYDLFAAHDRPQNFYMWGAMGSVSSLGLGLAMARPDLRVLVLDGDGSLLMNLGSLATISTLAPTNLVHVVFDNKMYETTGRQPSHTARGINLAALARAARITGVREAQTVEEFAGAVSDAWRDPGPWLILAAVEAGSSTAKIPRRPIYYKDRFMDALRRT